MKTRIKCSRKSLPFIICIALTVATALFTTGCSGSSGSRGNDTPSGTEGEINPQTVDNTQTADNPQADITQLGEGGTQFTFTVVDKDGGETYFEIHTDKETVGEALLELELIAGDESGYGLFVKTVNGITVDYDKDGKYWAFYVNDEYASAGVDVTEITEGADYKFKVE